MKKILITILLVALPLFANATVVDIYSGAGDGYVQDDSPQNTYPNMRVASANTVNYTSTPILLRTQRGSGNYAALSRVIFQFNTSSLGAGATISAVTLNVHSSSANTISNFACGIGATDLNVTTVTTASNTTLTAADYAIANYGSTPLDATTTFSSWTGDVYHTSSLNASGIAAINKTGFTSFSLRAGADIYNLDPGCAASGYRIFGIDLSESSSSPYLEITYTTPTTASFTSFIVNLGTTFKVMLGTTFLTK